MTILSGLRNFILMLVTVAALTIAGLSAPATAHDKKKHHPPAEQMRSTQPSPGGATSEAMQLPATAGHGTMGEVMEDEQIDRSTMSFVERVLDWLGRLHPAIVHFPIAFFPAAAFTAIVGRRREGFAAPVQFLVVAGGIVAPIAAIMGWLDAMNADPDPLLTMHRWLGTGIGIGGLALAVWAWLRPGQNRSLGMIVALVAITTAIIVQGWYGGAMVHGIDHINW